ncbi:MAG: hypothetical protein CVV49_08805 [Spirochaetae bacterium HGW-Spirochaetae-5]|nr:MAG: hypothetical protein CVV49_08805 [Spirochaetae bacterium HGW-Spirochaetae-5]
MSTSEGYWGTEFNGGRFSPITIPLNSVVDIEGDCLYIFTPVDPEKTYYFRVSATDTSYNESEKSNTVSLTAPIDVEQNLYNPLLDEYGSLWTTYGGAVVSTAVKKFGKRSLYLDGINSHLYKSINISGNKWCIEGEFYLTATPANGASLFQCGNKNIYVIRSSSNYKVSLYLSSNGTTWDISFNLLSSTVMDLNKFYHIALEYDGTKYVLYINGIPEITKVSSVNILAASYCRIASPTYYATKGYVDEVRITVGAIRYGGAFTPSLSRFPKDSLGTTNALLHFETGPDDSENRYNLAGNPYQGFILDMTNPGAGSGNTEWAEYDIAEFDTAEFTPTAVYQSAVLRKIGGYNRIIYRTIGGPGDVMIQYRTYSSGIFGAWSDLQDCYNTTTLDLQGNEFIQYRVVFNSPNWTDSDKFMIKEVS